MTVSLQKATIEDAQRIHELQVSSFASLLTKYQDYETSPANETLDRVLSKINEPTTDFYLIRSGDAVVGAVRVVRIDGGDICRISPIFILPEHQNKGIGQKAMKAVEDLYPKATMWRLRTILNEEGNRHLYEKMGYVRCGEPCHVNERLTLVCYEKSTDVARGRRLVAPAQHTTGPSCHGSTLDKK